MPTLQNCDAPFIENSSPSSCLPGSNTNCIVNKSNQGIKFECRKLPCNRPLVNNTCPDNTTANCKISSPSSPFRCFQLTS